MRPEATAGKFRCEGTLEREVRARGFRAVAGVDEVGRGSLFGPVVAAAVILSPERPVRGLNDSKQLAPERREVLAERIRERAVAVPSPGRSTASTVIDTVAQSPSGKTSKCRMGHWRCSIS